MLNKQEEIKNSVAGEKQKADLLKQVSAKYWADVKEIDDKIAEEKRKKEEEDFNAAFAALEEEGQRELDRQVKQLEKESALDLQRANDQKLSFDERLQAITEREALENQIRFDSQEERTKFEKENAKAREDIAKAEAQAKINAYQFYADQLSAIANLVGKDTATGKALSVSAALISTYLSAQKAYESQFKPVAIVDSPVRGAIAAGVAIASGLANVKKILSVKVPGQSGGGQSASGSSSFKSAPIGAQLSSTALNQQMVNQMSAATTRAFVLESDVSGNQERITRLNRAARIN